MVNIERILTPSLPLFFILFTDGFICSFACLSTGVSNSCYCFNGQLCEQCSAGHISFGGHYSPFLRNGYAAPPGYGKPSANHYDHNSAMYKETSAHRGTPLSAVNGYEQSSAFIQEHPFNLLNEALLPATNIQSAQRLQNLTQQQNYAPVNEYNTPVTKENAAKRDSAGGTLKTAAIASTNRHRLPLHQIDFESRNEFARQEHINQKIRDSAPFDSAAIEDAQRLREITLTQFVHVQPKPLSYQANQPNGFPSLTDIMSATASQYLESNAVPDVSPTILSTGKSIKNQWSTSAGTQKSSPHGVPVDDGEESASQRTSYNSDENIQPYYSENEYSYETDAYSDDSLTNTDNVSLSKSQIWSPKTSIYAQTNNHITEDDDRIATIIPNQQSVPSVSSIASSFRPLITRKAPLVNRASTAHETIQPSRTTSDYPHEYSTTASFDHHSAIGEYKSSTATYSTSQQETPFLEESREETETTKVTTPEPNDGENFVYNYKPFTSRNSAQQISVNYENSVVKFTIDTSTSRQMPTTAGIATEQPNYSDTPSSKNDSDAPSFFQGSLHSWQTGKKKSMPHRESSNAEAIFEQDRHEISTFSENTTTNVTHGQDVSHQRFSMINKGNNKSVLKHESLLIFSNSDRKTSKERASYHSNTIDSTFQQFATIGRVDEQQNQEHFTNNAYQTAIDHQRPIGFVQSDRQQTVSPSLSNERNAVNASARANSTNAPETASSNKSLDMLEVDRSSQTTFKPHSDTEEPTAFSRTNEPNVVSTSEEPNLMTAFDSNPSTTPRQGSCSANFSRSGWIKSKSINSQKLELMQDLAHQNNSIIDHRTDHRVAKEDDPFAHDNTLEEAVPLNQSPKILRQTAAPTPMNATLKNEVSALLGVDHHGGKGVRGEKMYSASSSKVHVLGSHIKEATYAGGTIELNSNEVHENVDEHQQIEVPASHITAETNLYVEPVKFETASQAATYNEAAETIEPNVTPSTTTALNDVTERYMAELQQIHEEKRNHSTYVTYYNQVCTGISIGILHGATMKSAANQCAALECEATNARPEGGGRYEVVFLKKVDGRRSKAGSYCVSGVATHIATTNKHVTHSKKLNIRPIETTLKEAVSDIEFGDEILDERSVGADDLENVSPYLRRRIIIANRFVTSQPKSES